MEQVPILVVLVIAGAVWMTLRRRLEVLEKQTSLIAGLTRRIYELELEVAALRVRRADVEAPPAVVVPEAVAVAAEAVVAEPVPEPAPEPEPPAPATAVREPAPAAVPAAPSESLETKLGLNWVNRAGVLTLILGVAFFFKYAVDNAWIGETGRVLLGVLAGVVTLAIGDRLWARGQRVFAQGAMGLALATLYLSFTAAFHFYHLIPAGAAAGLMTLTTAVAGGLSLRRNSQVIAIIGLIGGYLTPILLSTGQDPGLNLFLYLFVINCGVVWIALARRWPVVSALGLLFTAVLFLMWADKYLRLETTVEAVAFCLVYYAQFATARQEGIVVAAQVLLSTAISGLLGPRHLEALGGVSLAPVGAALGIAWLRRWRVLPLAGAAVFWLSLAPWAGSNGHLMLLAGASVGFAAFLAWTPVQVLARALEPDAPELLLLLLNGGVYFGLGYTVIHREASELAGLFAVVVAGAHVGAAALLRRAGRPAGRGALLAAGLALALVTLAIPIQFSGYTITLVWAVQAAGVAWISARLGEVRLAAAAAGLYALVLARLTVDISIPIGNLFLNSHFLTFLTAAVALHLASWWWRRARAAGLAYFAGHAVFFVGLAAQLLAWAGRNIAAENYRSAETAIISILLAAYAFGFIAGGVVTRTAFNRLAGLVLFGVIILKLYLYDVWLLERFYRFLAFLALGGLLVAGSYLYSRFSSRIQALWRAGDPPAA